MQKKYKKFNVIHPFLISLVPVLFIYSQNIHEISILKFLFLVLSIFLVAVLLWLLVRFIIKNNEKAGLIISLLLVLSFSYGHVYLLVDDFTLGNSDLGRHRYLIIPFVISFIVGTYYFVKTKVKLNKVTTIFNVFAATFLAVILINIVGSNVENIDSFDGTLITTNTSLKSTESKVSKEIIFYINENNECYYWRTSGYDFKQIEYFPLEENIKKNKRTEKFFSWGALGVSLLIYLSNLY